MRITKRFSEIKVGETFVEVMTSVNTPAARIKPTKDKTGRVRNARRADGKLIYMAEWEPVFVGVTE